MDSETIAHGMVLAAETIAARMDEQNKAIREVANSLEHIAEAIDRFADALEELARAAKRGARE